MQHQPPKAPTQRGATCAWKRTRHRHLPVSGRLSLVVPAVRATPFAQTGTQLGGCFGRLGLPVTVGRAKSLVPRVGEYVCLKRRQHRVTYSSRSHTYIYQRPPLGGAAKCELTQNGHVDTEPRAPPPASAAKPTAENTSLLTTVDSELAKSDVIGVNPSPTPQNTRGNVKRTPQKCTPTSKSMCLG